MKKIYKYILFSVATLGIVAGIALGGGLFWIQSNHGLQWLQSQINARIPGKLTLAGFNLSLVHPELSIKGVALKDPQGHKLAGFSHLSVGLDWQGLWQREVRVNHLVLQEPWADVVANKDATINLMAALVPSDREKTPAPPQSGSAALPFNIVFNSIQLTNGRFTFAPADDTMHLEAAGLNISGAGNFKNKSGDLEVSLKDVLFSSGDLHPLPADIVLKAQLTGGKLSVSTFKLNSGQTAVKLFGSADHLNTEPVVDTVLTIDSQMAELAEIASLAGDYSGPVQMNLSLKGKVANPDAKLMLSIGQAVLAGQPLDRGELAVELKGQQVNIKTAAFQLADGTVKMDGTVDLRTAFPAGFLKPPKDINTIAYALKLAHNIPHLNRWLQRYVDLKGATDGQLSLTGKGVIPAKISAQLTLQAAARQLNAPGMEQPMDADVHLTAQMDHGALAVSRLNITTDGLELAGDGHFLIDTHGVAAKMSLVADDLSRALAVAGVQSVGGALTANLRVDGSVRQPQFSLDLASKKLKCAAYSLGNLVVQANMDQAGLVQLTTLKLQNKGSRIEGKGRLRLLPVPEGGGIDPKFANNLELSLDHLSPADFMQAPSVKGTIDGRLQVDGALNALTGKLVLTGKALSNNTVTIGDVASRIWLKKGTVVIDRLQLDNKGSALQATGSIQLLNPENLSLLENPLVNLTADAEHINPADFVDSASGDFSFEAAVKGSFAKPVGRITLTGKQASFAGQSLENLVVDARFKDKRVWVDQLLVVIAPGEQLKGGGSVGLDKTMDLSLQSTGISIASIQKMHEVFPGKGVLKLDVTAKGKVDNPDIAGQLAITDIVINEQAMKDARLSFSLHDMLAKVTGKLDFAVQASCDLKKGDFNGQLLFDRTETAGYFKAAGQPDMHGTLTGQVQANGNIHDAARALVQVDLQALQLMFKDVSLLQSNRIALQLADGKLTVPPIEMALLSSGSLKVQGDARLGGSLNMQVDTRIPLAVAGYFSDELGDATGTMTVQGKLTGNTVDPHIDGSIDMENIGMTVPGLVQKLHDLNGLIVMTPNEIRVDKLKGFLDTGSFALSGTVAHEKFTPQQVNLHFNAKALPVEVADTLSMLLNADINVTGKDRLAGVTGEIVLLEGLYYKDVKINLLDIATDRKRSVTPPAKPVSLPYFDTVKLDVKVKNRQPFYVQNNLADLEIDPDIRIIGDLNRPIIGGRALVKSGTITFQKKTFEVKKGVIDFVNPYRTEAVIDIQSEAIIRSWTITLAVKGTPDNLDLKLSSVPAESDSDILSLILFGRTGKELVAGEGGSKRSNAQLMAGMIADTLGEDIKKNTGVDILQLETGDGQDTTGTKVTVGKHLSDRMTVKYAVESKDGTIVQRAITEYKLLERILLSGFQDNQGVFGGELMFRVEFR